MSDRVRGGEFLGDAMSHSLAGPASGEQHGTRGRRGHAEPQFFLAQTPGHSRGRHARGGHLLAWQAEAWAPAPPRPPAGLAADGALPAPQAPPRLGGEKAQDDVPACPPPLLIPAA